MRHVVRLRFIDAMRCDAMRWHLERSLAFNEVASSETYCSMCNVGSCCGHDCNSTNDHHPCSSTDTSFLG